MPTFELTYELKLVSNTAPLQVTKPQDALSYLFQHCFTVEQMWRERSVVLFLDKSSRILGFHVLSDGGTSSCTMSTKDLVRAALIGRADGVILSHNHPSDNPRPSQADIQTTREIKNALSAVGLQLIDHIIVTPGGEAFSFAEEKIIKKPCD